VVTTFLPFRFTNPLLEGRKSIQHNLEANYDIKNRKNTQCTQNPKSAQGQSEETP